MVPQTYLTLTVKQTLHTICKPFYLSIRKDFTCKLIIAFGVMPALLLYKSYFLFAVWRKQ